jgi:hypothetical protein
MILVRPLDVSDLNHIYHSWLKSCRKTYANIDPREYYATYKREIEDILSRSEVAVACDPRDPGHIYGYVVYKKAGEALILHYAYTKGPFRRLGVFKSILKSLKSGDDPIAITHKNFRTENQLKSYKLIFRPELRRL